MTALSPTKPSLLQSAQIELGRFFQLFAEGVKGLNMPSRLIDSIWHKLYTDPAKYQNFCKEHGGVVVGHSPAKGEGAIHWIHEYEKRFGQLHPVWFMDDQGNLDENAYHEYLTTGEWTRASWDCTPGKHE
ncbi:hypothetical protein [Lihuaxuella thermophila]|uniref:Uncharacterized protein n=1 Tax=Lihuaxuella thermophila TaxID=1173111 RepID=A0A1H8D6R9_9BACL|nr:hypothetical protein [Lihuaxuella thermophila]SEN02882.1 hypothetical protein SAMN05444955_10514 [Lihuaxuella thermophila]